MFSLTSVTIRYFSPGVYKNLNWGAVLASLAASRTIANSMKGIIVHFIFIPAAFSVLFRHDEIRHTGSRLSAHAGIIILVHGVGRFSFGQRGPVHCKIATARRASFDIVPHRVIVAAVGTFFKHELHLEALKDIHPPVVPDPLFGHTPLHQVSELEVHRVRFPERAGDDLLGQVAVIHPRLAQELLPDALRAETQSFPEHDDADNNNNEPPSSHDRARCEAGTDAVRRADEQK